MMVSSIFLAGAIAAAAMPARVAERFERNYPTWAVREGKSAAAVLDLQIQPDGKVSDCKVVSLVGNERLALERCEYFKGVRMTPAIGPDGSNIIARYRTWINLWVDSSSQERRLVQAAKWPPDMTLRLAELQTTDRSIEIELEVLVNATGAVQLCEAGRKYETTTYESLVEVGCAEVTRTTFSPLHDSSGTPVEHVVNFRVRFEGVPSS